MPVILLADDHAVVRRGLADVLADLVSGVQVEQTGDFAATRAALARHPFDLLVLDIIMPDGNGLEFLKEVRHLYPELPVLVLSVHSEQGYALRALRAGATAYLAKDCSALELESALQSSLAGKRYLSAETADRLVEHLQEPVQGAPHEQLSDREFQVLELLARGKTVGTIGDMLGLSPKTVSTYRTRLLEKLALQNDAELVRYALDHELIH